MSIISPYEFHEGRALVFLHITFFLEQRDKGYADHKGIMLGGNAKEFKWWATGFL